MEPAAPVDPFLTVPGARPLSYGDIDDRSAALAGALRSAGLVGGDRVVAQVDKSPDAIALYLACLRSGVIFIPINTAYTDAEVQYFVDDAGASLLICAPERESKLAAIAVRLETLGTDGSGTLARLAVDADPVRTVVDVTADDVACILYTSGTTGRSKGAMLTHSSLLVNGRALHQVWAFEPGDVLLHILPVFHVHGLFVALHCAMLNGSEVIFCPQFDVTEVRALLPSATVMMGVPTHYIRLLADQEFSADDCAGIRLFTSGSAPMTELVHREFTDRTNHRIVERYGMTEAGIITSNPVDGDRIPGTVGFALPDMDLRVVDGSVQIRGPHLFSGYWQMPDKTAAAYTDDGWFVTGDVGEMADDGRVTLAGRAGDMIISGGYNVYPKEIELVIDETPGVDESAIIGVPHPDFGEGVVAVISYEAGADPAVVDAAISSRCGAELARFKHPKQVIPVDELPRNAMGKVQKAALRSQHAQLFT
jgi:malonyl-CoA/methylmalonyl-CoA synthetase